MTLRPIDIQPTCHGRLSGRNSIGACTYAFCTPFYWPQPLRSLLRTLPLAACLQVHTKIRTEPICRTSVGRASHAAYLHGGRRGQPELFNLKGGDLFAAVRADFQRTIGLSQAPCFQKIARWPQGIPQHNVAHLGRLRRIDESVSKLRGLTLTGNAYRGVGLNDCIRDSASLAEICFVSSVCRCVLGLGGRGGGASARQRVPVFTRSPVFTK